MPVAPSMSLQCLLPGRCSARAVAGNGLIQPVPGSPDVAKPWGSPLQPAQHSLLPSPLFTRCWGWRMKRLFPPQSPPHVSPAPVPEPGSGHAGCIRLSLCPAPPAALPLSGPAALPRAGRGWRQPRAGGALLFSSSRPKAPVATVTPCQAPLLHPCLLPKTRRPPLIAQCCTPNHPLRTASPPLHPGLLLPGGARASLGESEHRLGTAAKAGLAEAGVRGQRGAGLSVCRAPCTAINLERAAAAPAKNHIRCVWQRLDMRETRGLDLEEGGSIPSPSPCPPAPRGPPHWGLASIEDGAPRGMRGWELEAGLSPASLCVGVVLNSSMLGY